MRTSIYDGLPLATLQARLLAMQTALMQLQSGAMTTSVSYAQGDGSRSVTYSQASITDLTQAILALQSQIDRLSGVSLNRRRPMRPVF